MDVLIDCQQGSPAWHAARAQHFCASEAAAAMGVSKYVTRTQLLNQKATGIVEEVSATKQRLFDAGHEAESKARSIAERIAGVEFYPVVGTLEVDGLKLLASFDGIDVLDETIWESKLLNSNLVRQVHANDLEPHYWYQLEHQLLVSGAIRALFTTSDGTVDGTHHCWYESQPERRAALIAGWKQFAADLATHIPTAAEVSPTGKAPEALPALHIVIQGGVSASNLDEFKETALGAIRSVNRELTTDIHFADAEKAVKWCSDIEDRIKAAKDHAMSQTASIDALFRTMDEISAEARDVRLELSKLVKARKEAIKGEIVSGGVAALYKHIRELNAALPANYMPQVPADFGGAIKGLRTVDSIRNAVDTELARAKIAASEIANRIHANVKTLQESGLVVHDAAALVLKAPDDLAAVIAQRQAAEQARLEAERERIRAEEAARIEREAAAKAAAEKAAADRAERERAMAEAQRIAPATSPVLHQVQAPVQESTKQPVFIGLDFAAGPDIGTPDDDGARLTLGQINERIAPVSINVAGLASLGFEPVEQVKASRLYRESDLPAMCRAIAAHVMKAGQLTVA